MIKIKSFPYEYLSDKECIEQFKQKDKEFQNKVIDWAKTRLVQIKSKNEDTTSYSLKHYCEETIGEYVHNDDMKAGMIICGFKSFNADGLNQIYNISKKSVKEAQRESYEIRDNR